MKLLRRLLAGLPRGVQFALLGSLLFALRALSPGLFGAAAPARPAIVVGAARVAELRQEFRRAFGHEPGERDLDALLQQEIDDQLLENEARLRRLDYGDRAIEQRLVAKMRAITTDLSLSEQELLRQALALGLDDDAVVRRQLREKMRLLLRQDPAARPLTDAELQQALGRYRGRFERPSSYGFTQIFFSAEQHGAGLESHARAAREKILSQGLTAEEAQALADPFPLDAGFGGRSEAQIAKIFGSAFAAQVAALEPLSWSAPLASPFGLHLVYLREKQPGGLPPLDSVRSQLIPLLEEERAERRVQEGLEELRRLYVLDIAW